MQAAHDQAQGRRLDPQITGTQMQAVLRGQQSKGRHACVVVVQQQRDLPHLTVRIRFGIPMAYAGRHSSEGSCGVLCRLDRCGVGARVRQRAASCIGGQWGRGACIGITRCQQHVASFLDGAGKAGIGIQCGIGLGGDGADFSRQRRSVWRGCQSLPDLAHIRQACILVLGRQIRGVDNGLGPGSGEPVDQPRVDVIGPGSLAQGEITGIVHADDGYLWQRRRAGDAIGCVIQRKFKPLRNARGGAHHGHHDRYQCTQKAVGTPHIEPPRRGFSSHLLLFHFVLSGP